MFTFQTKLAMAKAVLTKNSPFYIQFYISKYCHLKCKMCNIVEANSDVTPFKKEQIEKIADNLEKIGAGVILLTGGEPFMRPDIAEIVRVFKARKLDVRMQTAGLLEKKDLITKCVENGARDINVSLDSLDEGLSDYINGVKDSWKKAIKTISFISKVFPSRGSICALGCVLSHYNLGEIEPILEFATRIGWWLSLVPVHINDPKMNLNFRGFDENFKIPQDRYTELKSLIQTLKQKKRKGYNLFDSDDYLDSIYHFITHGRPSWRYKGVCDTPNLYFAILPDGRFAPCCDYRFDEEIYVYDPGFPKLFKSKAFRSKVKEIAKHCPGCNVGSFPEMTLSARSFSTIKERMFLQRKANKKGIRPLSEKELFAIIEDIRDKYDIYKRTKKNEVI